MSRVSPSLPIVCGIAVHLLFFPTVANALLWPVVTSVRVVDCAASASGMCAQYDVEGTAAVLDMGADSRGRNPAYTYPPRWYGVHCAKGDKLHGYQGCGWSLESHGPSSSPNCNWAQNTGKYSWELDARCTTPANWRWGRHSGADAGGECAVFGYWVNGDTVETPWAILNPTAVANSGSAWCVKPSAPNIPCEVGTLVDLDHGTLGTDTVHTVKQTATVSCGGRPSIEIVGGTAIDLAEGVSAQLSAVMTTPTTLSVESRLTTRGGTPGRYSSSKIVVVSPE